MSELITRTARLVPYSRRPRGGNGYVSAFMNEPAPDEPAAAYGSLYIVSEVLVSGRASEDVTDLIIETFGEYYYNRGELKASVLDRFETAVKHTNQELAEYVNKGNAAWIGKMSCVIAVISGQEVHLAHTGSAEGFLYRGKSSSRITSQDTNRPSTPTKTFSSIASGELEAGDKVLLATPALVHHVPLAKLTATITNASPNGAASELSALLANAPSDRVSVVIIEITTPELAALALRSDEPSEQQLGAPSTPLEAAKIAALPFADQATDVGKSMLHVARDGLTRTRPLLRRTGLAGAAALRKLLAHKSGRLAALGAVLLLLALGGWLAWQNQRTASQAAIFKSYQTLYQDYQRANLSEGDQALNAIKDIRPKLAAMSKQKSLINSYLANSNLLNNEPTTFDGFEQVIARRIDQLSGVETVSPVRVASLTSAAPGQLITNVGGKYYIVLGGSKPGIHEFTPTNGQISSQLVSLSGYGTITSITPSATGEGVYLLTNLPQILFWRTDARTVSPLNVSFGSWPKSESIGTYATNLYLLSEGSIYKFLRNTSGYSPKTLYASLASSPVADAKTFAVDGSIYVLGSSELREYVAGTPGRSVTLPDKLAGSTGLRSVQSGRLLTAVNPTTNRVLIFAGTPATLSLSKQLKTEKPIDMQDAIYDAKTKSMLVITPSEIVRLPVGL